jgi:hypothetical protein
MESPNVANSIYDRKKMDTTSKYEQQYVYHRKVKEKTK